MIDQALQKLPLHANPLLAIVADSKTGCWLWSAYKTRWGYGMINRADFKSEHVHKFVWSIFNGPVIPPLSLDHLCRVKHCVNPSHLEAVTVRENILRGSSPVAENSRKIVCKRGHNNWRIPKGKPRERICRTCDAAYKRASYVRVPK